MRVNVCARCCGLAVAAAGAAAQPVVHEVVPTPGYARTVLTRLSADGAVAVGYATNDVFAERPVRWTLATGAVDLGLTPGASGGSLSGVSNDGVTAAGFMVVGAGPIAVRWTEATGFETLPQDTAAAAGAGAVNADGSVIAGSLEFPGVFPACRWVSGVLEPIGYSPLTNYASPAAISDDGNTIVGESGGLAFRWTPLGGFETLPVPVSQTPGVTYLGALALGVSADGTVIGGIVGSYSYTGGFVAHPFLPWRYIDGVFHLQQFTTETVTQVRGITSDGLVLYGAARFGSEVSTRAVLWAGTLPSQRLDQQLLSLGADLTGWELESVEAISADRATLVGRGRLFGVPRAFVVTGLPCLVSASVEEQPLPDVANSGETVTFSVVAADPIGASYQWYKGADALTDGPTAAGSEIAGANAATLKIVNVQRDDRGMYRCLVGNTCSFVNSQDAELIVDPGCGETTETIDVGATCLGVGQSCGNYSTFVRETCGTMRLRYNAAPGHCSDVGLYVYVDGLLYDTIPPVGPGLSSAEIELTSLPPGPLTIDLEGYGVVGGCNVGSLTGWGGTVDVTTCTQTPTILTQPYPNLPICRWGESGLFIDATGGASTELWQIEDPSAPGTWIDLADGGNFPTTSGFAFSASGQNSTALSFTPSLEFREAFASGVANFRCVVINPCGSITSDVSRLSLCVADQNCDGVVDDLDFQVFSRQYDLLDCSDPGMFMGCPSDLNLDGVVDDLDFQAFVLAYNEVLCP
jgi:uncharacterized membrane protein